MAAFSGGAMVQPHRSAGGRRSERRWAQGGAPMAVEIRHIPLRGQDVPLLDRRSLALFERVGEVGLEEVEAILEAGETANDAADYLAERYHIDNRREQRQIIAVARRRSFV